MAEKDRLQEIEAYLSGLSSRERDALSDIGPDEFFARVKGGDAASVLAALKKHPYLANEQDKDGLTPLHWAAQDKSGVMQDILTQEPNQSVWTKDNFGRLPLDTAQEFERDKAALRLERLTYPQLFRDEKDGPVSPEQIAEYYKAHKEHGRADTAPEYSIDKEEDEKGPRQLVMTRDTEELER